MKTTVRLKGLFNIRFTGRDAWQPSMVISSTNLATANEYANRRFAGMSFSISTIWTQKR